MPPVVCLTDCSRAGAAPTNSLKSAAYAEPKDGLFLVKEEGKPVYRLVATRVGIISINQSKWHVQNRDLQPQLPAHAAADIGEFSKQTLVKPDDRIGLRVTAKKNLLQAKRQ